MSVSCFCQPSNFSRAVAEYGKGGVGCLAKGGNGLAGQTGAADSEGDAQPLLSSTEISSQLAILVLTCFGIKFGLSQAFVVEGFTVARYPLGKGDALGLDCLVGFPSGPHVRGTIGSAQQVESERDQDNSQQAGGQAPWAGNQLDHTITLFATSKYPTRSA